MIECNVNIPFYGDGRLLSGLLESLAGQVSAGGRISVMVVDDDSPCPAGKYIFASGIRCGLLRNPRNLGMVRNWNLCLEFGSHECVHVLHYDDLLDPMFYLSVLPVFESDERIGLVYTDSGARFSRRSSSCFWVQLARRPRPRGGGVEVFEAGDDAVRQVAAGVACSSAVIRRSAIRDVGLFRTDLPYSSDEEYWARIASRWKVAKVGKPLTIFRCHKSNHELDTWLLPDFWDQMKTVRRARYGFIKKPARDDWRAERERLSRLALSIAFKLLARGHAAHAKRYLERAREIHPDAVFPRDYDLVGKLLSMGRLGRTIAWLRSPH